MIDDALIARIRRLHFHEHWKVGTICTQLQLHHDTVKRALHRNGRSPRNGPPREWEVEAYLPFVGEKLKEYPDLTASRLFEMIRERGYPGGVTQLRRAIVRHELRPPKAPEAFATRCHLPGEEAQVDWAHFGYVQVGRARRPIYAFLMVLPYSRDSWVGFYHDMKSGTVLQAHVAAFEAFGGVPRRILYDNMKTAVLEREGDAIRFHPALLNLADAYGFEPVACKPRRPTDKGSVERRVRDLRSSFLAGTVWASREQYEEAYAKWRRETLFPRAIKRMEGRTVEQLVAEEQPRMKRLPPAPFTGWPVQEMKVHKQPWITVDTNRYSVPPDMVGKHVSVMLTHERVCVLLAGLVVCTHDRSWGRHADHELPEHRAAIKERRQRSREHVGRSQLIAQCPAAKELLTQLMQRGESTSNHTRALHKMLTEFGAEAVQAAILQVIARGTPRAASVRMALDAQRHPQQAARPLLSLPPELASTDAHINTHPFGDYDACTTSNTSRNR